jgi:hypothetical protein
MARNLLNTMSAEEKARFQMWSSWVRRAERDEQKNDRNSTPKIKRKGKTRRDHERGVHGNRFQNRQARVSWQMDEPNGRRTIDDFPWHACNGKRNRRVVTGQYGNPVTIERQRAYGVRAR